MPFFWTILFLLLITYAIVIISSSFSWKNQTLFVQEDLLSSSEEFQISIIIALRNESLNISRLIQSLKKQRATYKNFEAILIDDHSTDDTYSKLLADEKKHNWLSVYQLNHSSTGKKNAIALGIKKAKGQLLAFSDGDCILPDKWLITLAAFYLKTGNPDLIIGLVDMNAKNSLEHLFRLEFLSLVLSSAGLAILDYPILCNGANLAIKASSLKNYLPNPDIASGDDVFVLHHIKKEKGNIVVLKSPDHLVKTENPGNIKSFIHQRIRWASKSRFYTDKTTIIISLLVFLTNLALVLSIFIGLIFGPIEYMLAGILAKILTNYYLFGISRDLFKYGGSFAFIPVISIIYPFYVSLISLVSIKKPFTWKGRNHLR